MSRLIINDYENYLCDDVTLLLKLENVLHGCVERDAEGAAGSTELLMNPYDTCILSRT